MIGLLLSQIVSCREEVLVPLEKVKYKPIKEFVISIWKLSSRRE
jgi:hypothetical protein